MNIFPMIRSYNQTKPKTQEESALPKIFQTNGGHMENSPESSPKALGLITKKITKPSAWRDYKNQFLNLPLPEADYNWEYFV